MGNSVSSHSGGLEGLGRRNAHTHKAKSIDEPTTSVATLVVQSKLFAARKQEVTIRDERGAEVYTAVPEAAGRSILFSKGGQPICVLQQESAEVFVVFSFKQPDFDGVLQMKEISAKENPPAPAPVATGTSVLGTSAAEKDDAQLQARLAVADQRQKALFGQKDGAEPVATTLVADTADGKKEYAMEGGAKALYPFAKIVRDESATMKRFCYKMNLYDGNMAMPHWLGEMTWPGSGLAFEVGLPFIGLYPSAFQMVVRSAVEFGHGPVLADVDQPDGALRAAMPAPRAKSLAVRMSKAMDPISCACFAIAVEAMHK